MTYPAYADGYAGAQEGGYPGYGDGYAGAPGGSAGGGYPGYGDGYGGAPATPGAPFAGGIVLAAPAGAARGYVIDTTEDVLTLTAVDTVVTEQPGVLRLALTNGVPMSEVSIFGADPTTPVDTVQLDEAGSGLAVLSVSGLALGEYEVSAAPDLVLAARTAFNTTTFVVEGSYVGYDAVPPVYVSPPMPAEAPINHWVIQPYDLSGPVRETTLPVNPSRYSPEYGRFAITSEATVVGNDFVSWEGEEQPLPLRFGGAVLTKAQFLTVRALHDTTQRLYITDHLRRRRLVKITSVSFQRVRDRERPWHHTYEIEAAVL